MINKVILVGRLGNDPEVRQFDNDSKVCNFSIATDDSYKDKEGQKIEQTDWHKIVIWKPGLVGIAEQYLKKGSLVYIEGKLKNRSWDDSNGEKRYTTEIVVDLLKMLPSSNSTSSQGPPPPSQDDAPPSQSTEAKPAIDGEVPDDLPF